MRYSSNKDFNQQVRQLIKKGWLFKRRRKHCQITAPNGKYIIFSNSPSDCRAFKNFTNDIRHIQNGCTQ